MLRQSTQKLVFDLVTLWDRAFGGSTMVIHVDGPTVPDTPSAPQFIKAHVYLPPSTVVKELQHAHKPLAAMVQTFIEEVGIHTQLRWERVGKSFLGWNLSGSSTPRNVPRPLAQYVTPIPPPLGPNSSVYVFHRQPFSATTSSTISTVSTIPISTINATLITPAGSDSGDTEPCNDYESSQFSEDFLDVFDRANWHFEREAFKHREAALQDRVTQLEQEISALEDDIRSLKQTLQHRNGHLSGSTTTHFSPVSDAFEGIQLSSSRTSNQASPPPTKWGPGRVDGSTAPASSPSKGRSTMQKAPSTPTKSFRGGPPAAETRAALLEACTAQNTDMNTTNDIALRAKTAAMVSGYDSPYIHIIELVFTNVQQPFWHLHLLRYGFKEEDIMAILTAMVEDMQVS